MAVDMHPSRRPTPPAKPPATSTTAGTINKMKASDSGQKGVEYGARHELHVKDPNSSEMSDHFHASKPGKEHPNEGMASKAMRPGDERGNDEPG